MNEQQQLIQTKYLPFVKNCYLKTSMLPTLLQHENNQKQYLQQADDLEKQYFYNRKQRVGFIQQDNQLVQPKLQSRKTAIHVDPESVQTPTDSESSSKSAAIIATIASPILGYFVYSIWFGVVQAIRASRQEVGMTSHFYQLVLPVVAIWCLIYFPVRHVLAKRSLSKENKEYQQQAAAMNEQYAENATAENAEIDAANQAAKKQAAAENAEKQRDKQAEQSELKLYDMQIDKLETFKKVTNANISALQKAQQDIRDYLKSQIGPMKLRSDDADNIYNSAYWLTVYSDLYTGGSQTFGDALRHAHDSAEQKNGFKSVTNAIYKQTKAVTDTLLEVGLSVDARLDKANDLMDSFAKTSAKSFKTLEEGISKVNQKFNQSNNFLAKADQNLTQLNRNVYCNGQKLDTLHTDNLNIESDLGQIHSAIFASSAASTVIETAAINRASAANTTAIKQAADREEYLHNHPGKTSIW